MRFYISLIFASLIITLASNSAKAQSLLDYAKEAEQQAKENNRPEIRQYNEIIDSRDLDKYNKYLQEFPDAVGAPEISRRADEVKLWNETRSSNTESAYRNYLNRSNYHWYDSEARTALEVIDQDKIYTTVQVQSEFPGGSSAYVDWFNDNIEWPRDERGRMLHGDVRVEFIIERDGSLSNVTVAESTNPALNESAIDLVSRMPKWIPAQVKNKPVRSPMGIYLYY